MATFSDTSVAPVTAASIVTTDINLDIGLVLISVASTEAVGVSVCAYNDTNGPLVEPGNARWFPVQNLKFLKVKSSTGTANYSYFAR